MITKTGYCGKCESLLNGKMKDLRSKIMKDYGNENYSNASETQVITLWQLEVGNDARMNRINLLIK